MILVTGASGLLGGNLIAVARQIDKNFVAIAHRHAVSLSGVDQLSADLTDQRKVDEIVQLVRPSWIVHCAALTNVDWCETHPHETQLINVQMSRNLAAAARRVGASMLYVSTDSVFDGRVGRYRETDTPKPLNAYASSKLAGEKAVQEECGQSLIVRTNIYGWNMQDKLSLAEWALDRLEAGQPVPGFEDVIFSPVLVNDLSEIVLDMMCRELTGLYHVAGSQACSKYEFAVALAKVFGLNPGLVHRESIVNSNLNAARPRITSLETSKVSEALSRQMPDLESGLERFRLLRDSGFVRLLKGLRGTHHDGN